MAETPKRTAPLPIAQAFVVCREIIEDCRSHDFVLIAPFRGLTPPGFPFRCRLSIYAHLTCGHGDYTAALELRDAEECVLWQWCCPKTITLRNPLMQHRFTLYDAVLDFPAPGRYNLVLLSNGEDLARHALHVSAPHQREGPSQS
jgi:hypothetical protein